MLYWCASQARPPRVPWLSRVFRMRVMNQLKNFLAFPVSGLLTPGILKDMATMQVESNADKSLRK